MSRQEMMRRLLATISAVVFSGATGWATAAPAPQDTALHPSAAAVPSTVTITLTDPVSNAVTTYSFPSNYIVVCNPTTCNQGPALSPDGTISSAPNGGNLTALSGAWSWGNAVANRPGEYIIALNGTPTIGVGKLMEVAHGGNVYLQTVSWGWFTWNNGAWVGTGAP
jgi:hypothetical protein